MTQITLKRAAKAAPKQTAAMTPLPNHEEFQAECEALTTVVAANLDAVLRPSAKIPALKSVTEAVSPAADRAKANLAELNSAPPSDGIGFVPPYSFILKHAGADPNGGNDTHAVTVSRQFLEFLLRCVLDHIDFDEQQYRKCNPDVAAAIKRREMHSGREHFVKIGYFEGRSGGVRVDEAWYLARNPDVAAAKMAGKFVSGAAQYRISGAKEWRVPNPQSEDAIRMWKDVLGTVAA